MRPPTPKLDLLQHDAPLAIAMALPRLSLWQQETYVVAENKRKRNRLLKKNVNLVANII